ncbi:MAG: SPFH domain-containing protein [Pseudomonadota bacterium]
MTTVVMTVPAGHVKVATLFGEVQDNSYGEGLHIVNPLLDFTSFDLRQKTHKEQAGIPAEDKLITTMDVSVQYRTIGDMAPDILRNTGTTDALIQVHMIPKLRSILREQGKGVLRSQDFFRESVQRQLQQTLQEGLSEFLVVKGLQVETVLIRDIQLPDVIRTAITETKKREQEVLKQQAELERFATEQDQKVKQAESELKAAKLEAEKIKELADAEAYKISVINETLAESPNYIELKRVEQWNGVLPVYAGGDSIPMIDLRRP